MFSSLLLATLIGLADVSGAATGTMLEPMDDANVTLFDHGYTTILGTGQTLPSGKFTLPCVPQDGFLLVRPKEITGAEGMQVYAWQPRVFNVGKRDSRYDVKLPPAVNYIIAAYAPSGELMRVKHWKAAGAYGTRYLFATDKQLRAVPAQLYHVFGPHAAPPGSDGNEGLPAIIVEPGHDVEIHALFWDTGTYGRLQLPANVPTLKKAGDSVLINWNIVLAQTAIAQARVNDFTGGDDPAWFDVYRIELDALEKELPIPASPLATFAEAKKANEILVRALELADKAAIERGKRRAKVIRKDAKAPFEFGVYQGSHFTDPTPGAYQGKPAFIAARDAGFNLATVLPAWGWTAALLKTPAVVESTFGVTALKEMGYNVKAHGVCWLQNADGIFPPAQSGKPHADIIQAALKYQAALVDFFGPKVSLWEAINEPATTNCENFTREEMIDFLAQSAAQLKAKKKATLVNSPHEFNYGAKFDVYTLDNKPLMAYPDTFASFLDAADQAKALKDVDIIGLQVYPGFHLAGDGNQFEGPAWTPAYFERMLNTYAAFKKTLHITEFCISSTYDLTWKAGYWKHTWDEPTQGDYAEAAYTIAFGHPSVQSIGWWDITDEKPSFTNAGLLHKDRTPKPVFNRLSHFIAEAGKL